MKKVAWSISNRYNNKKISVYKNIYQKWYYSSIRNTHYYTHKVHRGMIDKILPHFD